VKFDILKDLIMTRDPRIPANYQTVMPYLVLMNAAGFLDFTEKIFGAKETFKVKSEKNTIMHAEIMIGDSTIMFADANEKFNVQTAGLFVYVNNADETYNRALEAGAIVKTALSDQQYGRTGGVTDPFGNTWWITSIKQT
jgi:PhnB protein